MHIELWASAQAEFPMFVMYQLDPLTQNMNEVFFVTTSVSIGLE